MKRRGAAGSGLRGLRRRVGSLRRSPSATHRRRGGWPGLSGGSGAPQLAFPLRVMQASGFYGAGVAQLVAADDLPFGRAERRAAELLRSARLRQRRPRTPGPRIQIPDGCRQRLGTREAHATAAGQGAALGHGDAVDMRAVNSEDAVVGQLHDENVTRLRHRGQTSAYEERRPCRPCHRARCPTVRSVKPRRGRAWPVQSSGRS
jgi:hypothetical protein